MPRVVVVVVVVVVVIAALALACACADDPLGPGATSECDPLADPAVRITSEALTADGRYVVVLGEGRSVFYGIPAHMVEGSITSTKPGCALEVAFEVQGRAYAATFSPDATRCMVASVLVSGEPGTSVSTPLTLVANGGAPLTFYCL